jgi:polysaccharide export outer membrane protein
MARNMAVTKGREMILASALLFGTITPLLNAQDKTEKPSVASSEPAKPPVPEKVTKADDPSLTGYTVGEQDVLDIDVWREKELSGTVVVRPDGKITVILVGEIYVIGMTPLQVQETLIQKMQPFLPAAQVTVSVKEINSRKVYLMGKVGRPGVFRINSTTTVSEIIAEAGGLRDYAKHKKIYILRNENGNELRLPFDYDGVIKGKVKDIVLKPGDKIVVP